MGVLVFVQCQLLRRSPGRADAFLSEHDRKLFRDIVQVHLPWWFVENSLRLKLVESDYLVRVFGSELGFKLRYAIQKANYDVSVGPFDYSLYSDLFIVMERYESEYPELTNGKSALDKVLAESFARLKGYAMMAPYGDPHSHAAWNIEDYGKYRDDLIILAARPFTSPLRTLILPREPGRSWLHTSKSSIPKCLDVTPGSRCRRYSRCRCRPCIAICIRRTSVGWGSTCTCRRRSCHRQPALIPRMKR